jgi:DNA adenine methylase
LEREDLVKPFTKYVGGKRRLIPVLLPLIPRHRTYVEVFGGAAALLFAKEPSPVEVYNDIDSGVVNVFRIIRDAEKLERLQDLLHLFPFSREESKWSYDHGHEIEDDVLRAAHWLFVQYTTFGGKGQGKGDSDWSWGYSVTESSNGISSRVNAMLKMIDRLPEAHARLRTVQIENGDFRRIIERYDTEETFFYCDPDYIPDTCSQKVYANSMRSRDHLDLIELLGKIKGKAVVSGYSHYIYRRLEQSFGWHRTDVDHRTTLAGQTKNTSNLEETSRTRLESIWVSP